MPSRWEILRNEESRWASASPQGSAWQVPLRSSAKSKRFIFRRRAFFRSVYVALFWRLAALFDHLRPSQYEYFCMEFDVGHDSDVGLSCTPPWPLIRSRARLGVYFSRRAFNYAYRSERSMSLLFLQNPGCNKWVTCGVVGVVCKFFEKIYRARKLYTRRLPGAYISFVTVLTLSHRMIL